MSDSRPVETEEDVATLRRTLAESFSCTLDQTDEFMGRAGRENWRVVDRQPAGAVAGGLLLVPMGQWFGGRSVPTAGIAAVGIAPEQRGRGAAARLMCGTLREAREQGVALSTLYPSTHALYRRAGYEMAGTRSRARLPTREIDVDDRVVEIAEAGPGDESVIEEVVRRRGRRTNGNLDRGPYVWSRVRQSKEGEARTYLFRDGGSVDGYVRALPIQQRGEWMLYCRDVVALTPAAGRRILTFFASHRTQLPRVEWFSHPHDPLLFLLPDPVCELKLEEFWMLRLVDLPAALTARGYPEDVETEIHLDVTDDVLPANAGRHLLRVAGGRAQVQAGGRGDVRVDVRGLAALYSGHLGPRALRAAAGLDASPENDARLASVFAGPSPWMPQMF